MTSDTQPEQCNGSEPQEAVKPVTETNELLSQSAVEVPTEVPPSPAPMKPPEPRRSQRVHRAPKHLEDYVFNLIA